MSSPVRFSSPFIKGLTQSNTNVSATTAGTAVTILPKVEAHIRRAVVIVQNQNTTNYVYLLLGDGQTSGLLVPPLGSITFDNYNGVVKAYASGASIVHVAYATA